MLSNKWDVGHIEQSKYNKKTIMNYTYLNGNNGNDKPEKKLWPLAMCQQQVTLGDAPLSVVFLHNLWVHMNVLCKFMFPFYFSVQCLAFKPFSHSISGPVYNWVSHM